MKKGMSIVQFVAVILLLMIFAMIGLTVLKAAVPAIFE